MRRARRASQMINKNLSALGGVLFGTLGVRKQTTELPNSTVVLAVWAAVYYTECLKVNAHLWTSVLRFSINQSIN